MLEMPMTGKPLTAEQREKVVEEMAKGICETWYRVSGRNIKGEWDAFNAGGKDSFRRDAEGALQALEQLCHVSAKEGL